MNVIKYDRESLGLNQEEYANKIGVSIRNLRFFERDIKNLLRTRYENTQAISAALRMSPETLLQCARDYDPKSELKTMSPVKRHIVELGISIKEFSRISGLTVPTLHTYINNPLILNSAYESSLSRLCEHLNIDRETLLDECNNWEDVDYSPCQREYIQESYDNATFKVKPLVIEFIIQNNISVDDFGRMVGVPKSTAVILQNPDNILRTSSENIEKLSKVLGMSFNELIWNCQERIKRGSSTDHFKRKPLVKEYRDTHGLTAEDIAKQMGISVNMVFKYSADPSRLLKANNNTQMRVSKILGMTKDELIWNVEQYEKEAAGK